MLYGVVDRNINFSTLSISFSEGESQATCCSALSVARPLDTLWISMWYHAHYSHRVYKYTKRNNNNFFFRSPQDIENHFIIIEMKSKKKGKKKSNKNCLNINNFGIIQKRHLFARLTLLFHMPFDVKKHFYYFLWWFRLNDKKRKATLVIGEFNFIKKKILRRWRNY